jgi:hypothetical protein
VLTLSHQVSVNFSKLGSSHIRLHSTTGTSTTQKPQNEHAWPLPVRAARAKFQK